MTEKESVSESKVSIKLIEDKAIGSAIYFNSKAKEWYQLSNFYGGVEEAYASLRFPPLAPLLSKIAVCSKEEFLVLLKAFQPGKKWNQAKENFWFDEKGEPIRGILAKLLMNSFPGESTSANKKRA
jgi:hypothetical protein